MSAPIEPRLRLRMIEIILHWVWDPIGVRGIAEAADEYNGYAGRVLSMLNRGASADEIAAYLSSVEQDRMELASNQDKNGDIAEMLCELHAASTDLR